MLNHTLYPSLHPPLLPSIYSSSTSCLLVVCRLEGRPPCSDTHARRHTPPRCVTTNSTCLFPSFPVCCSVYLHLLFSLPFFPLPFCLSVLPFNPPHPPHTRSHAVCHRCREERKMLRPTEVKKKTQKRVKEETFVCVKHSDASIHHQPDSSLMEYLRRRRAEGGRRGRRRKSSE